MTSESKALKSLFFGQVSTCSSTMCYNYRIQGLFQGGARGGFAPPGNLVAPPRNLFVKILLEREKERVFHLPPLIFGG